MKPYKIIKIDNYNYTLMDTEKQYVLNLAFLDNIKIQEGDILYLHPSILDKDKCLTFGIMLNTCGKKFLEITDEDIAILKRKENVIYLKRLYG